ncbi:YitT family protein [Peribacillus sp. SCS-26]|uniref:YitT family protein n=1 Tax=Paraperibacillus marinus TaxID=3115295 RepID=UPI00390580FA
MRIQRIIAILVGSILLSLGINMFLVPYNVLDGGVIGLGLILHYLWSLKAGVSIIVLSIPIFILAWFKYREYFYSSMQGMFISSLFIDLFQTGQLLSFQIEPAISSIIGGVLVGTGIGLMLRYGTSTGGTDLLAQMISVWSGVNVGISIFIIDSAVISLGGILISAETFLLSVITVLSVGLTTSLLTWRKDARLV